MRSFAFLPSADPATNRWLVYYRLQDLNIACECGSHQPLIIDPQTPYDLLQAWGVCRQVGSSKAELVEWLNRCWQQDATQENQPSPLP